MLTQSRSSIDNKPLIIKSSKSLTDLAYLYLLTILNPDRNIENGATFSWMMLKYCDDTILESCYALLKFIWDCKQGKYAANSVMSKAIRYAGNFFRATQIFDMFETFICEQSCNGLQTDLPIILKKDLDPATLPYADVLRFPVSNSEEDAYHPPQQIHRLSMCIVLARGDSRSPQELLAVGGMHPPITNPNYSHDGADYSKVLNIYWHRALDGRQSGFLSLTSDLRVAKDYAGGNQKGQYTYVYLIKASGALSRDISRFDGSIEFNIPGGVDFEDIIAYRRIKNGEFQDEIHIRKTFLQQYPAILSKVKSAFSLPQDTVLASFPCFATSKQY
jgi:hypothetical protein